MTRTEEKQAARDQDERDLASGKKTVQHVQEQNGFIRAAWGLRVDLKNALVAG